MQDIRTTQTPGIHNHSPQPIPAPADRPAERQKDPASEISVEYHKGLVNVLHGTRFWTITMSDLEYIYEQAIRQRWQASQPDKDTVAVRPDTIITYELGEAGA